MNKRQTLAIILVVIAIFFSLTSIAFNFALTRAENFQSGTVEKNVSLGHGTIQITIEPQEGRRVDYENKFKR